MGVLRLQVPCRYTLGSGIRYLWKGILFYACWSVPYVGGRYPPATVWHQYKTKYKGLKSLQVVNESGTKLADLVSVANMRVSLHTTYTQNSPLLCIEVRVLVSAV